jgi:hypothetical protein
LGLFCLHFLDVFLDEVEQLVLVSLELSLFSLSLDQFLPQLVLNSEEIPSLIISLSGQPSG